MAQMQRDGLESFLDIVSEAETERDRNRKKRLESILTAFPKYYRNAANNFNENINIKHEEITHFLKIDNTWVPLKDTTTRDFQWILKKALNRISETDFEGKLDVRKEIINPLQLRKDCKNPKTRNIYFRMIHNDFFTHKRMFTYKMTATPNCPRCNQVETSKHLLWECEETKKLWKAYNDVLKEISLDKMNLILYEDLFKTETIPLLMTIKLRMIQELIQINRPTNWNTSRTLNIIFQIRNMEMQNSSSNNKKILKRWENFKNLTNND
jgi:hypothetical protein